MRPVMNLFHFGLIGASLAAAWPALAAEQDAPARDPAALREELVQIEDRIQQAHQSATESEAALLRARHRQEQEDPAARGLREDIASLQKRMHALRQELAARLKAIPEIQEYEKRRREAFHRLRDLKQQAETLKKEIASAARLQEEPQ